MDDDPIKELLRQEGERRYELHGGDASPDNFVRDCQYVGLVGQRKFAEVYNQPFDWKLRPNGDGGIDFVVPLAFSIDITASRKPKNLIQRVGKVKADIYVLAQYFDETDSAELLGWEYGAKLKAAPTQIFRPATYESHFIPRAEIRHMDELGARIMHMRSALFAP